MAVTARRRYSRYVKGMRRIKEDRMEHGDSRVCSCFDPEVDRARGRTFSYFADNPQLCSRWCCGNQRRMYGPTRQEKRAPTAKEFFDA